MIDQQAYYNIIETCKQYDAELVAVTKTRPLQDIASLYALGHRKFGENRIQELGDKTVQLPNDIEWHLIGHLQSNKLMMAMQHADVIQSVDSIELLNKIALNAAKSNQSINILLQVHIAMEAHKYGFTMDAITAAFSSELLPTNGLVNIVGLMGMASFTSDKNQIAIEFNGLRKLYENIKREYAMQDSFKILSMGMSGDYEIALAHGATLIRVGSLLYENH